MKKYLGIGIVTILLIGFAACKSRHEVDKVSQVELPTEMIDNDWNKALALSKEKGKAHFILNSTPNGVCIAKSLSKTL